MNTMRGNRRLELVSAAADGDLRPGERAELDRLLEENPDAREFQADLRKLESLLAEIPSPDMPETLHGDIMARIPVTQRPLQRLPARSTLGWLRAPTPVFRYGLATAAGVLLAAIIYESPLTFSPATDRGDLVGTMAPTGSRSDANLVDSYTFRTDGLETLVELERHDDSLLVDIRIDSEEPVDLAVNFTGAGSRLEALSGDGTPLESISLSDGILRIEATGRRRITAHFRRADDKHFAGEAKIGLEISSKGKLLRQGSLATTW
ncbi:MAG TPA: hypothetical protein VNQ14_10060 [Woeseiaceae bacterium]|nr:hypothetical protein [Woeseiaceae bacterium]